MSSYACLWCKLELDQLVERLERRRATANGVPNKAYGQLFRQNKLLDTDLDINKQHPDRCSLTKLGGLVSLLRLGEQIMWKKRAKTDKVKLRFFLF